MSVSSIYIYINNIAFAFCTVGKAGDDALFYSVPDWTKKKKKRKMRNRAKGQNKKKKERFHSWISTIHSKGSNFIRIPIAPLLPLFTIILKEKGLPSDTNNRSDETCDAIEHHPLHRFPLGGDQSTLLILHI